MGFKISRFFKKNKPKICFPIIYDYDVLFVEGLNCKFRYKNELDIAIEETKQVFKKADILTLDLDKEEWISYYAPSTKQPIIIYHKSGVIERICFSYSKI
jgi:hypothetical protein